MPRLDVKKDARLVIRDWGETITPRDSSQSFLAAFIYAKAESNPYGPGGASTIRGAVIFYNKEDASLKQKDIVIRNENNTHWEVIEVYEHALGSMRAELQRYSRDKLGNL